VAVLDEDLRRACLKALTLSRGACRAFAQAMTWEESARHFLDNVAHAAALPGLVPGLRSFDLPAIQPPNSPGHALPAATARK
jgi:hypothetical protein